jgi:ABC-2 type transport system ATP-binding protein
MGVLLATHDLAQAEILCTRVGLLRAGKLCLQGPPRQLIENAFGTRKEVVLEMRRAVRPEDRALLERAGFAPANGGLSWMMLSGNGEQHLERLAAALRSAGIDLREIRLREPGLDSLFFQFLHNGAPIQ